MLFSQPRLSPNIRSSRLHVFCKKGVLENFSKFTGKDLRQSLFFIKKEILARVFSCEFYEISKNTLFYRIPPVAAFLLPNISYSCVSNSAIFPIMFYKLWTCSNNAKSTILFLSLSLLFPALFTACCSPLLYYYKNFCF